MKDMFATMLRQTLSRSDNPSNPSDTATAWWAVGAAAAAIALTTALMVNRRNTALDVCRQIGGMS